MLEDSCQLVNLHPGDEQVPTYSEGGKKIDHIFGTQGIAGAMTQNGISDFATIIPSDHRGLFIDLDAAQLFGNMKPLQTLPQRILKSADIKRVHQYKASLFAKATEANILP